MREPSGVGEQYKSTYPGQVFGDRWVDYTVLLSGWVREQPPRGGWFWRMSEVETDEPGGKFLQVREVWVRRRRCPLWLHGVWNPEPGRRITLVGLEKPHTEDDVRKTWRGIGLLRAMSPLGRRPGTPSGLDQETKCRVAEEMRQLRKEHKITWKAIADTYGVSVDTAQRWVKDVERREHG